jgi:hypothetical protein
MSLLKDFNEDGILRGRPYQEINVASTTQYYPVGTKFERHGRTYRYCKAAAAITISHRGCPNLAYIPWHSENTYTSKMYRVVSGDSGAKECIVTLDDSCVTNSQTKDYFAGGWLVMFHSGSVIAQFRVTGSDVSYVSTASGSNYEDIKIYLDEALPWALVADTDIGDLHPSPYMNVGASTSVGTYGSVVCVPGIDVASGSWFWGQTKGPCWVTPNAGITTAAVRDVYFHTNGTIKVNSGDGLQRAGYLLDFGDGSQDDALIMLQLE